MEIAQQKGGVLTAAYGAACRRRQLVQDRGLDEKALRIGRLAAQHLVGEELEDVVTRVCDADQKGAPTLRRGHLGQQVPQEPQLDAPALSPHLEQADLLGREV